MYSHPLTNKQLEILTDELGFAVYGPIAKTLACGDVGKSFGKILETARLDSFHLLTLYFLTGVGAMTEWSDIVKLVVEKYKLKPSYKPMNLAEEVAF